MARAAFGPRNRNQRVLSGACARCAGPLDRARRGPAPRWCLACDALVRDRRQVRAYLRSAARIALRSDLPTIAELAAAAADALDQEPWP